MSNKSYLLGSVRLSLTELKKLSQYYQNVKTYDAKKNLIDKIGEDGKPEKYIDLNFSIFEEGRYGQNVSFTLPQTKEQREAGEKKRYVSNGKIYYASDDLKRFVQQAENKSHTPPTTSLDDSDDLPF